MKIFPVINGHFKLDGGAMFGVVPKALWNKTNPADENNMIDMVTRCMLIIDGERKILVDAGFGDKQDETFRSRYQVHNIPFEEALGAYNVIPDDITDVIMTHLHFDHCGGGTKWNNDRTEYELTFKNANYYISRIQFENGLKPNKREKASLLPENINPYSGSKQLKLIEKDGELLPNIHIKIFNGHTLGQVIPFVNYNGKTVVYTADFLALSAHIPIPFVMSYDIDPLLSMDEKEQFYRDAVEKNYILFFEHDPKVECCNLRQGKKGVEIDKVFSIDSIEKN
jgi:glyoxylase-like metal-dependent hydrolase (beta-lactamase superfamily II)